MLKRLIEVALPLKEVSEQSAREKSIRHGHISTLHIWWARRPLAACRAAVFASLIPDPDDPACPKSFKKLVMDVLKSDRYKPTSDVDGSIVEDTPRNRCLEFIKHLVRWENSNNLEFIKPAQTMIRAAHPLLHPDSASPIPRVLDPFSGGGAIPLEAARLGCESNALDINPVAHLLQLCTLVYPQKYGQPDSRPVPSYIQRLAVRQRAKQKSKHGARLFVEADEVSDDPNEFVPNVAISESDYKANPLAADFIYWAYWVLAKAEQEIGQFYPKGKDGGMTLAYIWAQTLPCPNPSCKAAAPLIKQFWLSNTSNRKAWMRLRPRGRSVDVLIEEGEPGEYDPSAGTIVLGAMQCPVCGQGTYDKNEIKTIAKKGLGLMPLCVVTSNSGQSRHYRNFEATEMKAFDAAQLKWEQLRHTDFDGLSAIPNEEISRDFEWVLKPPMFGLNTWGDLHNPRQGVALATFAKCIRAVADQVGTDEYGLAVCSYLTLVLGRLADKCAIQCVWNGLRETLEHVFGRQAIPMSWDYGEVNPFSGEGGGWESNIDWVRRCIVTCSGPYSPSTVRRGSATRLPLDDESLEAVITDPPYYDAVPYSDLSDFFYVWHKRALKSLMPELYRTPVTPKTDELVQQSEKVTPAERRKKTKDFFEAGMKQAFQEISRVLTSDGIGGVMFAHSSTAAWEALIRGMIESGLCVSSSWPLHTERKGRLRANNSAALASSILLVCRKRLTSATVGLWDDVRKELQEVGKERLDFFWSQGIRGADFFISAIGPALSVFGQYEQVTKLDGEPITVGQFLDEVRGLVTNYALTKILKTSHTGSIDPESRFYVVWKWSYGDVKVPADESFKLAQALGMSTDIMWDRTGVLEKSGENVQMMPVAKRMKVKELGEANADGSPASLIDVLHRMCVFREKNDTNGMAEFLARSGQSGNQSLWLVAQAISEILPDGEKEKQLMQGLLNQKDTLEDAKGRLF